MIFFDSGPEPKVIKVNDIYWFLDELESALLLHVNDSQEIYVRITKGFLDPQNLLPF